MQLAMDAQKVLPELEKLVAAACPADASFRTPKTDNFDCEVFVSWLLRTDVHRPKKRTRPLTVFFPGEAVGALEELSGLDRERADARIVEYLEQRITRLNLDHDADFGTTPPGKTILVPEELIALS